MSSERESKADAAVAAGCSGGVEDAAGVLDGEEEGEIDAAVDGHSYLPAGADHVARRIPDDVWGLLLQFCPGSAVICLRSACSWLHSIVLSNVSFIKLQRPPSAFSAARLTALHSVVLGVRVEVDGMLPTLIDCPQLRHLELSCTGASAVQAVVSTIAAFPRLRSVHLRRPSLSAQLGKALAACKTLRDVELTVRAGSDRRRWPRDEFAADFLSELASFSALRKLEGLSLRDEDDCKALCAAVTGWPQLEELHVTFDPDHDGGSMYEVPLTGIAAAVASSCVQLRKLYCRRMSDLHVMSEEDVQALACMTQLRQLCLLGFVFATSLAPLSALTRLQQLKFSRCCFDEGHGMALAAVIGQLPLLQSVSLSARGLTAASMTAVLGSIKEHSTLEDVSILSGMRLNHSEKEQLGTALAEALCLSPVQRWSVSVQLSLLAFLTAWNGRVPAAAVRILEMPDCDDRTCVDDGCADLLLRCVRSLPSPSTCYIRYESATADILQPLISAIKAEPLAPSMLQLVLQWRRAREYSGAKSELHAVGLTL